MSLCDKGPKLNFGADPSLLDSGIGGNLAASARIDCGRSLVGVGALNEPDIFIDGEPECDAKYRR